MTKNIRKICHSKPTKRLEKWWGKGVKLLNFGKSWEIYETVSIESEPILEQLRQQFYPDSNSILLYFYTPGVGISSHTDKPVFNPEVVVINLIDAGTNWFGDKPSIKFKLNQETKVLKDGDVVRFNALMTHGLPPVKVPRYSLSFRIIENWGNSLNSMNNPLGSKNK